MNQNIFRSKLLVTSVIFLFILLLTSDVLPQRSVSAAYDIDKLIQEGKELYKNGEYERAIKKFLEVKDLARTKEELSEAYFNLSASYYANNQIVEANEYLQKLVEVHPEKIIDDRYFPKGFIEIYNQLKSEFVPPTKKPPRPVVKEKPIIEPVAAKRGGGGLLLALGAVAAGGAAAAVLLGGKKEAGDGGDGGGNGGAATGSIQVNSSPIGASVYLDGSNTGQTTNCTLTDVSSGSHTVRLVKEGYEDYQESVSVSGGQTSTVNATLTMNTITVTNPTGGTAWEKGEEIKIEWETNGSASLQGSVRTSTGLNPSLHPGGNLSPSFQRRFLQSRRSFRSSMGARRTPESAANKSSGIQDTPKKSSSSSSASSGSTSRDMDNIHRNANDTGVKRRDSSDGRSDRRIGMSVAPGRTPQRLISSGKRKIQAISNVKIELYSDDSLIQTIASSTENDGYYEWTVDTALSEGGDYKLRICCASDSGVYGESDTFRIASSLEEAVDNPDFEMETGGDADWFAQTDTIFSGGSSAQSGAISHNESTYIQTTIAGSGTLSFYWKVSSEENHDYLKFYINDVLQDSISGEGDWEQKTFSLDGGALSAGTLSGRSPNQGTHILKWEYSKDSGGSDGEDCGWIDEVIITGSIQVNSTPTGASVYLDGEDTGEKTNCTLTEISPGNHTIKLVKEGYKDYEESIDVELGQTSTVDATLNMNTIIVTSPTSSTIWTKGKEVQIQWEINGAAISQKTMASEGSPQTITSSGNREIQAITDVKIELYKGDTLAQTIISSTENDGSYTWTVDTSLTDGTDYKVRISCATDSDIYGESGTFTIEEKSITITTPTSSTVWTKGQLADISWTSSGTINDVKIDLYKGGTFNQTIVDSTDNDGSYTWSEVDTSLAYGTDYKVRVSSTDDSNINGESEEFEIISFPEIEWVQVPAGSFEMGDNFNEGDSYELPVHTVYLDTYYISKYEVTFDQYDAFCDATGRSKPGDGGWGRGTRPVIYVSWNDAKAFCDWLSARTGENIHLPTEAQWEKAARGTDQRRYPWGNNDPTSSLANYNDNAIKTMPVGSYPSGVSPYGVHDMAGNVYEWCSDWYLNIYYQYCVDNGIVNNPQGPSSNHSNNRVTRGGCFDNDRNDIRSARRGVETPNTASDWLGFRLCKNVFTGKSITVTEPTSSTVWTKGQSAEITWTSTGTINAVKLDLYKGGTFNQTIVSSTVNNNSYTWPEVDTLLADGTDYKVRVSSTDDSSVYGESVEFTIEEKSITVTEPTSSTTWTKGFSATVEWDYMGTIDNVKIDLYKGGTFKQTIKDSTPAADKSYTWNHVDPNLEDGTDYTVRVSLVDTLDVYDDGEQFKIISFEIEWVQIPAGSFEMGDNFNEGSSVELPVHTVYVDTYYISKYEVTFEQYDAFCDATGRTKPSDQGWGREDRPVINVSWNDAKAFCDWLSAKTGENIHLPTEAQWEKAARGTDQRRYPWGNDSPTGSLANYNSNEGNTVPVGSYPAGVSPYGIHDMAGNVWEWCSDWYDKNYYSISPTNNPQGPSSGTYRVLRGGTWYGYASGIRSAIRNYNSPSLSNYGLGIRLCKDVPVAKSITVTEPTSSTVWTKGQTADINWTSTGAISNVNIDLYKGSTLQETIASSIDNDGTYAWEEVSTTLDDGTDYKVRVSNSSGPAIYDESDEFTIEEKSITVTEPTSSTIWTTGQPTDITWTSTGTISNVKIDLYKGSALKLAIAASTGNNGAFVWTVDTSLTDGTDYIVKISSVSDSGIYGVSNEFEITHGYIFMSKWGSQGNEDGQFNYPREIAVDNSGYVYVAGGDNNRIQKFTSDGTFVTKWGSYGGGEGQFAYPNGIAVDNSGFVYVADTDNNRIQKFTSDGIFVSKWGWYGTQDGLFISPKSIAVDSSGYVYVADSRNDRIQKFTSNGTFAIKWGSSGSGNGQFNDPNGIAVDNSGYVYVIDGGNDRIQKFDLNGNFITKWGNTGNEDGQFDAPCGIAVDSAGYVYVTDIDRHLIQKFKADGTFMTKWGWRGSEDGQLDNPHGIAVDSSGYVYVTERGNHRIQKFQPVSSSAQQLNRNNPEILDSNFRLDRNFNQKSYNIKSSLLNKQKQPKQTKKKDRKKVIK